VRVSQYSVMLQEVAEAFRRNSRADGGLRAWMKQRALTLLLVLAALIPASAGAAADGGDTRTGAATSQAGPTITSISPRIGFFRGGTRVTIVGTDLGAVTEVHFGSIPARSVVVESPTRVVALSPATGDGSLLHVTVATADGATATSAETFLATACHVPKLKNRTVSSARSALRNAHCTLGQVTRAPRARAVARVIHQAAGGGGLLPARPQDRDPHPLIASSDFPRGLTDGDWVVAGSG
jgi:hypothetical protein